MTNRMIVMNYVTDLCNDVMRTILEAADFTNVLKFIYSSVYIW